MESRNSSKSSQYTRIRSSDDKIFKCDHWVSLDSSVINISSGATTIFILLYWNSANKHWSITEMFKCCLPHCVLETQLRVRKVCLQATHHGIKYTGSLGWSHRGHLQWQPSWMWRFRSGTACFCLWSFSLSQKQMVPCLHFFVFFFHSLCLPPPQPCK